LEKVKLVHKADAYPGELSGGQQQRVAIARALCMQPEAILFDEVTAALDPEMVGEVLTVIRDIAREGMTCVIVTHETGFAREAANHVYFTDGGLIVETAPPARFFSDPQDDRTRSFLSKVL
jgi:polar amino acid transport system ATP-binding protein